MYQHILVPTDGSDTARQGLREAIALAKRLDSRIRVLHVYNGAPLLVPEVSMAQDAIATKFRENGVEILQEAEAMVRAAGVAVEQRLVEAFGDRIAAYVVEEARAWPAQLIVCGTHGRRGLSRLVMGSDAELIVRQSPVPVLLIHPANHTNST